MGVLFQPITSLTTNSETRRYIRSAIRSGVSVHARSRDACSGNRGACSEYQCVCIPTAGMPTQATAAHTQHQQRTQSSTIFGNMLQPNLNLACMFVRCRGTQASGVCGVSCRSARLASLRVWFLGAGSFRPSGILLLSLHCLSLIHI